MSMLDEALKYIAEGYKVFPCCWPDKNHLCGCGRGHTGRNIGKAPLTQNGFKDCTQTQLGVKEYWGRWPLANIGIMPDDFYVLDVDVDRGGLESLTKLLLITGEFNTLTIRSGGGGLHFYIKGEHRNVSVIVDYPGFEIKGTRAAYVIAPPSMHASGTRYVIESNLPLAPAPPLFITVASKNTPIPDLSLDTDGKVPFHQRNMTLTRMAGALRRVGFDAEEMAEILIKVNQRRYDPPLAKIEVLRTVKSVARYKPSEINPTTFKGGASLEIR
jgi:hypothetical protein